MGRPAGRIMPGGQLHWATHAQMVPALEGKERIGNHVRIQLHSASIKIGENPLDHDACTSPDAYLGNFTFGDIALSD